MKALVKLCSALVLTVIYSFSAHAESGVVKVASLAWEDQMAIYQPTVKFLEKQGFKVEFTKFSEWRIAFGALKHGDVNILLSNIDYVTSDY